MNTYDDKTDANKRRAMASTVSRSNNKFTLQYVDNRTKAVVQQKMIQLVRNGDQTKNEDPSRYYTDSGKGPFATSDVATKNELADNQKETVGSGKGLYKAKKSGNNAERTPEEIERAIGDVIFSDWKNNPSKYDNASRRNDVEHKGALICTFVWNFKGSFIKAHVHYYPTSTLTDSFRNEKANSTTATQEATYSKVAGNCWISKMSDMSWSTPAWIVEMAPDDPTTIKIYDF